MAGTQNRALFAYTAKIAQPVQFIVVGDAGRAIAKADLGANIEIDLRTAVGRRTAKCLALAPLIDRERPRDLGPDWMARRRHGAVATEQRPCEISDRPGQHSHRKAGNNSGSNRG